MGTTCLLSVFQAITISLGDSCWNGLKVKAPEHFGLFTSLCWILYISVNMIFPVYLYTKGNNNNLTHKNDMKYCPTVGHDEFAGSLYTAFFVIPEILLSILIIWSSSSMVLILYRHKQQDQYLHSFCVSSKTSPKSKATQSILVLVFTFLGFYALSSILQGCVALIYNPSWWLLSITAIISLCFPMLGPFLMSHYATGPRLCYS